jgi:citrate lyase alpha subunit
MAADEPDGPKPPGRSQAAPRHTRRLTDKILIAFHHACDQGDYEVAEEMLRILEMMITRRTVAPDANRRKNMESLVAAHERLWLLRHPDTES